MWDKEHLSEKEGGGGYKIVRGYDPGATGRWLKEIKKTFTLAEVPELFRVEFAVYLLRGSVFEQCELQEEYYDVDNLSWDEFERIFGEKYVPEAHRHEMIAQFSRLVQGDMIVAEYHACFINLLRYNPRAAANPISRCIEFRDRLRSNI